MTFERMMRGDRGLGKAVGTRRRMRAAVPALRRAFELPLGLRCAFALAALGGPWRRDHRSRAEFTRKAP